MLRFVGVPLFEGYDAIDDERARVVVGYGEASTTQRTADVAGRLASKAALTNAMRHAFSLICTRAFRLFIFFVCC